MQIKFELVTYDEELDRFELDENTYQIELDDEEAETYDLLKSSDLNLYNWLKESDSFLKYIKEEVYQDSENKKFAISDINGISFIRFYFFKVTSGDSHMNILKSFLIFTQSQIGKIEKILEKRFCNAYQQKEKNLFLNWVDTIKNIKEKN